MDLLASLNIEELPEQQTRVKDLVEKHPDFDFRLGFDACCACGSEIHTEVLCPNCRRVSYCSEACRVLDATSLPYSEAEDSEQALGHAAVICSLLKLCQVDDDVEENYEVDKIDAKARLESADRIQSERESYPATLVNVLAEGPAFQGVWSRIAADGERTVNIHVIGASHEAEIWKASSDEEVDRVVEAYTEACSELMENKKLQAVRILMVGPECADPKAANKRWKKQNPVRHVTDKTSVIGDLIIQTRPTLYDKKVIEEEGSPDIVVFFNPGFTVPDYDWRDSLAAIPRGVPFLLATNTEVEGIADTQFLLDQDRVQSIPPGLQDIFGLYSEKEDGGDDTTLSFFSVNPFCGNRVRQSGTMANDLFVRNRWMLGGILDSYNPAKDCENQGSKKLRTAADSNRKATNPALI
eukprot:scaffold1971_cov127-Amphora_coffeaeformis.AAC.4